MVSKDEYLLLVWLYTAGNAYCAFSLALKCGIINVNF